MMDGLKPYPTYKDSGLPWLGPMPSSWKVARNGALFVQRNEVGFGDLPILEVSLKTGVRVRDLDGNGRKQVMADREKYKRARKGDLAYNMMRMWQGAVGIVPVDGLVSPAYVVARAVQQIDPKYFAYLFRTDACMREFDTFSRGIVKDRNRLYWEDFKQIPSPLPPQDEQSAIVRFLDHVEGRIRGCYIAAKRRLISLLNEQKMAMIHSAVTRGFDPGVRLKPSGVTWLEDVPEHWDVAALRMRYSVQLGKMLDAGRITGNHLLPYLRNTDVQWDHINGVDLPVMDIREDEYARYTVKPGDLLVCEGGEVGRAGFWDGALPICGYQKALHRVRPIDPSRDLPRFLYYLLYSVSKRGVFLADGSENTIAHLTAEKFKRYRFAFPPRKEQDAIARHLDITLAGVDQGIELETHSIEVLHEYRTRLVADVVTGKLDVRAAAARLPDETEEPDDPAEVDSVFNGEQPEDADVEMAAEEAGA